MFIPHLFARKYRAPGEEDAGGEGAAPEIEAEDFGNDFIPTEDDDAPEAAEPAEPVDPDGLAAALAPEAGAGEKVVAKPKAKEGQAIPVDRHKAILDKERSKREAAEAELAAYRNGQTVAKLGDDLEKLEGDVVELEAKYNDALADGDLALAKQLMSQVRLKERHISSMQMQHQMQASEVRAAEKIRLDTVVDRIEEQYPALDQNSDDYDQELFDDVRDMASMLVDKRGLAPSKALQQAVARILGASTRAQKDATTVTPRVTAGDVAAERRGAAVNRNVDAANRTPPRITGLGKDSDALGGGLSHKSVAKMSDKEFAKLKPEDIARLRGDFA